MDKYKQYSALLMELLASAFDEDSENFIEPLETVDLTQFFTALIAAQTYVFNNLTGDDKNLIEMTHALNGLAVQHVVKAAKNDE